MLSLLLLASLCTGCWDAVEINRLAIVTMSGFDLHDPANPHTAILGTVQLARPSQLGGPQQPSPAGSLKGVLVEEGMGANIGDVFSDIARQTPRFLYLPHRDVCVVGEEYARHGIGTLIDEMMRNPQSRPRTYLVTAYHAMAKHILSLAYGLNRLPSEAVSEMEQSGQVAVVDVKRFTQDLLGPSDPYTMGIKPITTSLSNSSQTFEIRNIAVYRKDRLAGWLDNHESDGFLWVKGRLRRSITTVEIPYDGFVSCTLLLLHADTSVHFTHGKPSALIQIYIENDIMENGTSRNFHLVRNTDLVTRAVNQQLTKEIRQCVDALQHHYDADCLGIGQILYERYPRVWHQVAPHWRQLFANLPIIVQVRSQVRRSGDTGPAPDRRSRLDERGIDHG